MSSKKKKKIKKDPLLRVIEVSILIFVYLLLLIFLGMNIFYSLYIPNIFFATTTKSKSAILSFISQTKDLAQFQKIYPEIKSTFKSNSNVINSQSKSRREQIAKLENLLSINPDSPELLYGLHLLYDADGNATLSDDYLARARAIDPLIGR